MSAETNRFTVWHGLFLAEGAALLIGLLMPITPSKIGSDRGLAHLFISEPSYLQQVLVYFALTNLLLLILGAIIAIWLNVKRD